MFITYRNTCFICCFNTLVTQFMWHFYIYIFLVTINNLIIKNPETFESIYCLNKSHIKRSYLKETNFCMKKFSFYWQLLTKPRKFEPAKIFANSKPRKLIPVKNWKWTNSAKRFYLFKMIEWNLNIVKCTTCHTLFILF